MWEAENICLLAQGVYFKAFTAILSITVISWESSSPVKLLHLHAVYTPLPPMSSTSAFGYTSDDARNLARGKAPLLTASAAQRPNTTGCTCSISWATCESYSHELLKNNLQLSIWVFGCTCTSAVTTNSVCFVKKGQFWFHTQIIKWRLFI